MPGNLDLLSKELYELVPPSARTEGTVCMLCGIAGSGKTTAAKLLEARGFVRLSIDEWIWNQYGHFGEDYEPSAYPSLQAEAEAELRRQLVDHMSKRQAVVVDFSFWQRSRRTSYQQLITAGARPWMLLYLKVDRARLLERLEKRKARVDANAAFPIGEELLDRYLLGFEEPSGEGEVLLSAAALDANED